MVKTEKIKFQRKRDFGQKLNATFEFIKQNLKPLLGAIIRLVGLPLLVFALIWGALYFTGFSFLSTGELGLEFTLLVVFGSLMALVVFVIFQALYYGTVYGYILLYIKNEEGVSVKELSKEVRSNLGPHVVTILTAIAVIVAVASAPVAMIVFAAAREAFAFMFIMFVVTAVLVFYVAISLSLFVVIRMHEKIPVLQALSRSFDLIRGKWWSTFGLLFVCGLIQAAVSYLAFIPYYAIIFIMGFSGELDNLDSGLDGSMPFIVISVIFYTVYMILSLVLSLLSYIAIAFQYYNLVELKEARGLLDRMESFGQSKPEDEGHY